MVRPKNSTDKVNELFKLFEEHNLLLYPNTIVQVEEISSGKRKSFI